MVFEYALTHLKLGHLVSKQSWTPGTWLALIPAVEWELGAGVPFAQSMVTDTTQAPWIGMKTADNTFVPWLPSMTDLFAKDWLID